MKMHTFQVIRMQKNIQIVTQQGEYTDTKLYMEDAQSYVNPNYKHKLHYQSLKVSILV